MKEISPYPSRLIYIRASDVQHDKESHTRVSNYYLTLLYRILFQNLTLKSLSIYRTVLT